MNNNAFRNYTQETLIFYSRNMLAYIFMLGLMVILLWRMYYLQVVEYDQHTAKSNTNRIKVQPLPPTRGLIYDRNGMLLAENQPMFMVTITKEQVDNLEQTLTYLQSLIPISPQEIESFHKRLHRRRRPYESVPLKLSLSEDEIAKVAVDLHALSGVGIEADLIRHYPLGDLTAHTIGYVGRINMQELQQLNPTQYAGTRFIGKIGVEKSYETELLGKVGHQRVETNARGKILRVVSQAPPTPGKNLVLSLDIPTQRISTLALGKHRGAIVAIQPKTGGILAMVSTPSFNPNLFVTGIDFKTYNQLNQSLNRPLFNRALKGQYPPGSTIKPMVALAGLDYGIIDWRYEISDPGYYKLDGSDHLYRDWKRWGHGKTDLKKALYQSCDTYFYELSHKLTIDRLHDFLAPFGLGSYTNVDIPGERAGILPSQEWKRANRDLPWYPGETLIAGIGQGFMLTTPLQLAVSTAILATRGDRIVPHIVRKINNETITPKQLAPIQLSNPDEWENIVEAMVAVVHGEHGTARKAGFKSKYYIAGKTGTAQVKGIKQDETYDAETVDEWHRDHALFIGFAPAEDPIIAVAVIVENAGGGGSNAAPVARKVMDTFVLPRLKPEYRRQDP